MKEWHKYPDERPEKNGEYLVVHEFFGLRKREIMYYTQYLRGVSKTYFGKPGWYTYNSEYGYVVHDGITHWMPLPSMADI